ncbi:MAG: hypothetical protein ABIA63_13385, partial [bacterium]
YRSWDTFYYAEAFKLWKKGGNWDKLAVANHEEKYRFLEILCDNNHEKQSFYEVVNFYLAGTRFAVRGRYDIAVFMMYRVMERISALCIQEYGIVPDKPDYPKLNMPEDTLACDFKKICRELYPHRSGSSFVLPDKIGFMHSLILNFLKGHPVIVKNKKKTAKEVLGEFCQVSGFRNKSIFTHGTQPLSKKDYNQIHNLSRSFISDFLKYKNTDSIEDFEKRLDFHDGSLSSRLKGKPPECIIDMTP